MRSAAATAGQAIPRFLDRFGADVAVRSMYERSTAFMRDWYRGPVSRKNSSTSASTRKEIGIFAAGNTGTASSQKSFGS